MTSPVPGYVLLDPRVVSAEAPYTFFLPNDTELAAISIGDQAKLIFEHIPPGEKWAVERMWVDVTSTYGEELSGILDNDPSEPNASIQAGDTIRFERFHVVDICWADAEKAPPATPHREYWERCLVDDLVLEGIEPIEFIYRELPSSGNDDDMHPDSGWRIRGRAGNATEDEMDSRTISYVALGAVLNRDDSWIHLIDAPIGASYLRDFERNIYVEESSGTS